MAFLSAQLTASSTRGKCGPQGGSLWSTWPLGSTHSINPTFALPWVLRGYCRKVATALLKSLSSALGCLPLWLSQAVCLVCHWWSWVIKGREGESDFSDRKRSLPSKCHIQSAVDFLWPVPEAAGKGKMKWSALSPELGRSRGCGPGCSTKQSDNWQMGSLWTLTHLHTPGPMGGFRWRRKQKRSSALLNKLCIFLLLFSWELAIFFQSSLKILLF